MVRWFSHASGIIISTAWWSGRPPRWRSSSTSSNEAESLAPGVTIGKARSSPGIEVRGAQRLAGPHPVPVAGQGVDLAVVGHVPVGVGQRPRREGVGREAGVDQGQAADQPLVGEVGVELGQLVGGQHPLVGDGPGRQRREVARRRSRARPACAARRPAGRWPGPGRRRPAACRRPGPRRAGASRAWPPRRSSPSVAGRRAPRASR